MISAKQSGLTPSIVKDLRVIPPGETIGNSRVIGPIYKDSSTCGKLIATP